RCPRPVFRTTSNHGDSLVPHDAAPPSVTLQTNTLRSAPKRKPSWRVMTTLSFPAVSIAPYEQPVPPTIPTSIIAATIFFIFLVPLISVLCGVKPSRALGLGAACNAAIRDLANEHLAESAVQEHVLTGDDDLASVLRRRDHPV